MDYSINYSELFILFNFKFLAIQKKNIIHALLSRKLRCFGHMFIGTSLGPDIKVIIYVSSCVIKSAGKANL